MPRPLYIPPEVKKAIVSHLRDAVPRAVQGFYSASADEDTLTGHLGALLKAGPRIVRVYNNERPRSWTWSIDYAKFVGGGRDASEHIIGADGIFELRIRTDQTIERKSLLFQAKKNWRKDSLILEQAIKLTTWKEAAFILNYTDNRFEAVDLADAIRRGGSKPGDAISLDEYLGHWFLDCLVGDTDLSYDARARLLRWKTLSGEIVAIRFPLKRRFRIDVATLPIGTAARLIPSSKVHEYRMNARAEEILSIPDHPSSEDLKLAKKRVASLYHPDKFPELSETLRRILTRRAQEASEAFAEITKKRRR